jgi:exonuclease III
LLTVPGPEGRDYNRRYFNLVASRYALEPLPHLDLAFPERYVAAVALVGCGREIELHNAHAPPGSTRGLIKIELFQKLHARLACNASRPRILCGDFNTPKSEATDGTVEFWGDSHPRHAKEWNESERSVICGLTEHDLPDVFRTLNGYTARDASWVMRRGGTEVGRRYDHIFASVSLRPTCCRYLHELRNAGLSDHAPILADFAAGPGNQQFASP